jgi:ribosomal protein L27
VAAPRKRGKTRRDYAAAYKRRDARARALGFKSYYDQRVRKGKLSAPRPTGAALRRARGHASGRDLLATARDGDVVVASMGGRDAQGRYRQIDITLLGSDGGDLEFTLRGSQMKASYLRRLVADLGAKGVTFSPAPSLDLRRIAEEAPE